MPEWSRDTHWRQGSFFSAESLEHFNIPNESGDAVVIVASHDCDLTQLPEDEPYVEVVIGKIIAQMDGNYTHTKNVRKLHLNSLKNAAPVFIELTTGGKININKSDLSSFEPSNEFMLPAGIVKIFQRWLAIRYKRAAFPDEFENRLKTAKLHLKIHDAIKPHNELIRAIFFSVDNDEEIEHPDPEPYILDITILHVAQPDFAAALDAASTVQSAIRKAFAAKLLNEKTGEWQKIELRYCDVASDEAMTYAQFASLKEWRLDSISLKDAAPMDETE